MSQQTVIRLMLEWFVQSPRATQLTILRRLPAELSHQAAEASAKAMISWAAEAHHRDGESEADLAENPKEWTKVVGPMRPSPLGKNATEHEERYYSRARG